MKTSLILGATLLCLSTVGGCKASSTNERKPEQNVTKQNCVLETKLASSKLKLGQGVELTIELKNTSSQKLWVNQRMLLNSVHAPVMMRALWVEVVGPDGSKIPFSSKVRAGGAGASDYNVLDAGHAVSRPFKLSNDFELAKPGVYRVIAHYQDGTEDVPKAPEGASHLRGPLESVPVTFELLAAP